MLTWMLMTMWASAHALPNGAPEEACADMMPQHGADSSSEPNPYTLNAAPCDSGDSCYQVTISGSEFKGFFIQARYIGDEDPSAEQTPQGFFEHADAANIQYRNCLGVSDQDAVTHTHNETKTAVEVEFYPDGADVAGMQMVATVVREHGNFWYAMRVPL